MIENNKIYLGDAYKLIKELPDKSVDLIITDPPYDIGTTHGSGIMKGRKGKNFMREIEEADLNMGIDFKILDEFVRVMKHLNIYIWCNRAQIIPYLKYFEDKMSAYEIFILNKTNPIPFCGIHYLIDKEYCLFFRDNEAPIHVTFERGKTVFSFKTNVDDKKDFKHPTIKNITIIENFILNSSEAGGGYIRSFLR